MLIIKHICYKIFFSFIITLSHKLRTFYFSYKSETILKLLLYLFSISISSSLSATKTLPNTKCRCPSLNNCPFLFGIIQPEYQTHQKIILNIFLLMLNDNLEQRAKSLTYDYWFTQFDFPDETENHIVDQAVKWFGMSS